MSNIIDIKSQKVSSAFAHLKVNRALGDGITAGGFPILNIRGKVWSLQYQGQKYPFKRPDDGTALTYLDVVILNAPEYTSKIYFPPGEFDEDSSTGPICSSIKTDVPDPGVPEPQSKTCASCRHNQWITKPDGRRGMECQTHKRLAILLMPTITAKMLGSPLLEPVYLKVPPGSLASLKAYNDQLAHAGLPFAAVLTRISFDAAKLFQINFDFRQALEDKEAPLVLPLIDDPRTMRIIGAVPEIREVIAAPKPKAPARVETGLVEAFTPAPQRPAGKLAHVEIDDDDQEVISPPQKVRAPVHPAQFESEQEVIPPPPVKKRGRLKLEVKPAERVELPFEEDEPQAVVAQDDEAVEEGQSDMDHRIAELLDKKIDGMLT